MLLESRFERNGRGAIYNNRRKGVPEGNNVNKKKMICGRGANIGPLCTYVLKPTYHSCRLGLLEKWRERQGTNATYKELAKAFHDAGRRELVDEICNIVNNTQAVDRAGQQSAEGIKMYFWCVCAQPMWCRRECTLGAVCLKTQHALGSGTRPC